MGENAQASAAGLLHTAVAHSYTSASPSLRFRKISALRRAGWVGFHNIHLLGTEDQGPQLPATVFTFFLAPRQLYFIFFIPRCTRLP